MKPFSSKWEAADWLMASASGSTSVLILKGYGVLHWTVYDGFTPLDILTKSASVGQF